MMQHDIQVGLFVLCGSGGGGYAGEIDLYLANIDDATRYPSRIVCLVW